MCETLAFALIRKSFAKKTQRARKSSDMAKRSKHAENHSIPRKLIFKTLRKKDVKVHFFLKIEDRRVFLSRKFFLT